MIELVTKFIKKLFE